MGCGSSSPDAHPQSVHPYPKQQYHQPSSVRGGGGGGRLPNRDILYNDNDPTDDIPPETIRAKENKPSPTPAPEPKPTPVVTEKKEEKTDPEPKPIPVVTEKKEEKPAPEPKPTPVVTEKKEEKTDPEPQPIPAVTEAKEDIPPPSPEPSPKPKETEDKVIEAEPVVTPTDEDVNEIEVKTKGNVIAQNVAKFVMGRKTTILDTRPGAGSKTATPRPTVSPGGLYTDESFTLSVAFEGQKNVEWKRPGEIVPDPCLFSDGTTRFDIGQGAAGTCWFLSIVSALAEREDIMKQVIPEDAYNIGTPEYDGIFHCRFWKFGEWVDIYIDDYLPIQSGTRQLWGANSATDKNEMWVSLLEKAFAKFQGSYLKAEGGWAGDAFIYLTGGIAERLPTENFKSSKFFSRVKNALNSGSVIACSVPESKDGQKGLVGGHAYTLTGATVINLQDGQQKALFRIRNPWGSERGEWTGDYSDKSSRWNEVDNETKESMNLRSKGDGEFWMTLIDYYKFFKDTHLCNFTPDFDEDGKEDNLDKTSCIFGEWKGPTAAGKEIEEKMKNQKFTFTLPKKNLESDGKLPVVLQFMQYREHRKSDAKFFIRADLYKIEQQFQKPKRTLVLDELTNNTTFWGGNNLCYRYRLEPGEYLILPTTMEPGKEKEFLIRLFASINLDCKEIKDMSSVFIRRFETKNNINGEIVKTENLQHHSGMWKAGRNAGGQIKHKSFETNPQYALTVSGKTDTHVMISLKQEILPQKEAIGLKIYKTDTPVKNPLDINYLWGSHKETMTTVTGEQTFIHSYECAGLFCLPPGHYVIIIFLESPDKEVQYILTLGTGKNANIKVKGMNIET